jgi:hypothetical protein
MTALKKILVGGGITAGIVSGLVYLFRLKRTNAQLETVSSVVIQKFDLSGIILKIDITLKNPTRTGFSAKFPFVKVNYKDSMIGSSQVIDRDVAIPPYGEVKAANILVQIPLSGLLSVGTDILKSYQSGDGVKLTVVTVSTTDLGIVKIPYEKKEEITIRK